MRGLHRPRGILSIEKEWRFPAVELVALEKQYCLLVHTREGGRTADYPALKNSSSAMERLATMGSSTVTEKTRASGTRPAVAGENHVISGIDY